MPCAASLPGLRVPHHHLLAQDRVYYQGHPVAVVVATDRYLAADAGGDIYGSTVGGPDGNGGGYVLAYPGAPRAVYGTISVRF